MKLYASELKKLGASRAVVGLFVCLMLLNAVLAAVFSRPNPADRAAADAYEQYLADPAATDAYFADLNRLVAENFRDESYTLPHTYTDAADDLLVLSRMYERADYLAGHEAQMARRVKAAEGRVADLQSYGYPEDAYEIRHQRALMARYDRLRGAVSPGDAFAYGYDDLLAYPMTAVFAGLFLTVAAAYVFRHDHACGFGSILRTTRGGHTETALAKLGAVATAALAATMGLSLSAFAAVGVTVGYSSPMAAVQTLPLCASVPLPLTIGAYLGLRLAFCALAMLTYAGLVALAASLKVSYVGCFGVGAVFWMGNYALFSHEYLGTPPAVRYLNAVALAEGNTLTDFYRSVSVLGHPVPHPTALCAGAVLLTVGFFLVAAWFFVKDFRGMTAFRRTVGWRFPARKQRTSHSDGRLGRVRLSLVGFELRKMRFGWGCLAVLILLGAKGVYTYSAAGNMERYDEALYYDTITAIQPLDPSARGDYLAAERARIDATLAAYPAQTAAYERGELSPLDFAAYLDTYYAARARDGVLRRVETYVASIDTHDRLTGRESDILYNTGMEVFFGFSTDWFFAFAVLTLSMGVFAVEYRKTSSRGSAASVIRTTARGREPTFAAKCGICAISGGLLAVAFRAVGLLVVAGGYILPALDATVSSVPGFGGILSDMSIGAYLGVDFAVQAPVGALAGVAVAALSCLLRRPLPILAAVLLLGAVPALLVATLFPEACGMSLLSLTTPQILLGESAERSLFSCVWARPALVSLAHTALVALLVFFAHRAYNCPRSPRKGAAL